MEQQIIEIMNGLNVIGHKAFIVMSTGIFNQALVYCISFGIIGTLLSLASFSIFKTGDNSEIAITFMVVISFFAIMSYSVSVYNLSIAVAPEYVAITEIIGLIK